MISDIFFVVEIKGRFARDKDRISDDWRLVTATLPHPPGSAKDYLDSRIERGEIDAWLPAVDASGRVVRVEGVPVYQLWSKFGRTLLAIKDA